MSDILIIITILLIGAIVGIAVLIVLLALWSHE